MDEIKKIEEIRKDIYKQVSQLEEETREIRKKTKPLYAQLKKLKHKQFVILTETLGLNVCPDCLKELGKSGYCSCDSCGKIFSYF